MLKGKGNPLTAVTTAEAPGWRWQDAFDTNDDFNSSTTPDRNGDTNSLTFSIRATSSYIVVYANSVSLCHSCSYMAVSQRYHVAY